eukprot:scaffold7114_cov106-Cylindrotheca_fusiformis.AAC.5
MEGTIVGSYFNYVEMGSGALVSSSSWPVLTLDSMSVVRQLEGNSGKNWGFVEPREKFVLEIFHT